ncbi:MAG: hypothetical protein J6S67_12505 [Methanobrevibacter sp.]|nr:hypothetical protein [Methanobrevibacter sp.]
MEEKKLNTGLAVTIIVTVLGWGVTFGVCQNKIENNTKEIARLEKQFDRSDATIQNINSQLAGLNAKMDLLIDGRLYVQEKK